MRIYVIFRYAGFVLLLNAIFLLVSALISALGTGEGLYPLLYTAMISLLFGFFPLLFVPRVENMTNTEGLVVVVVGWLVSCLLGIVPYLLWGGEFDLTNAWFESVSGYTTTGSTILTDIEALPNGLLFWRSATHWIGGIGIIVFVLAVMPPIGVSEVTLYRAEFSSFAREKLNIRARRAVQILIVVYVSLTLLETLLLVLCGMNLFDAATHSFGTVATGGFSTKNASMAHYDSAVMEIVVIVFMVLSGMHFGLLFAAAAGKFKVIWKSTAVRYYLAALILGIAVSAINLHEGPVSGWGESLRQSAFQVVSVGTSTGFATADTNLWPPLAQLILVFFTLQCACIGSTSGGIKADRMVLLGKSIVRAVKRIRHPLAVIPVRIDHEVIDQETVDAGILYIATYIAIVFCSSLLLAAMGVDLLSAFTGSAACMGNVGPGLGPVGAVGNFHHIPDAGKWILSFIMLLGRLEIYGLLMFLILRW
jgi:trk system potassium uptake protein TrkH